MPLLTNFVVFRKYELKNLIAASHSEKAECGKERQESKVLQNIQVYLKINWSQVKDSGLGIKQASIKALVFPSKDWSWLNSLCQTQNKINKFQKKLLNSRLKFQHLLCIIL